MVDGLCVVMMHPRRYGIKSVETPPIAAGATFKTSPNIIQILYPVQRQGRPAWQPLRAQPGANPAEGSFGALPGTNHTFGRAHCTDWCFAQFVQLMACMFVTLFLEFLTGEVPVEANLFCFSFCMTCLCALDNNTALHYLAGPCKMNVASFADSAVFRTSKKKLGYHVSQSHWESQSA